MYLFIAEPPVNARGSRKFVFDEFRCTQGPHVDTMFAWVPRGKSQMLKFHEKSTSPGSWGSNIDKFASRESPPSVRHK